MPSNKNALILYKHLKRIIVIVLSLALIALPVSAAKRALLVGISKYPQVDNNRWQNIHGANDVYLLSTTLAEQGFKNKVVTNKSATAANVRKQMNAFIASCKSGDFVYLHFSCHGQPVEDIDGDEEDGWDEAIVPFDAQKVYEKGQYEGANHILDDELSSYFAKISTSIGREGFLCVVIDACHAGGSFRGDEDENEEEEEAYCRGTKSGFSPNGKRYTPRINAKGHFTINKSINQSDILILEACRSYQSNYEIKQDGQYYGPLSYYLNKVLNQQPLSTNLVWTRQVKELMDTDRRLIRQNMVYETSLKQ